MASGNMRFRFRIFVEYTWIFGKKNPSYGRGPHRPRMIHPFPRAENGDGIMLGISDTDTHAHTHTHTRTRSLALILVLAHACHSAEHAHSQLRKHLFLHVLPACAFLTPLPSSCHISFHSSTASRSKESSIYYIYLYFTRNLLKHGTR
jgi:hypothetical protein